MSYTPINWATGDVITAEKLNKMDNGWGEGITELFSEMVTTVAGNLGNYASLTYTELVSANTLVVVFDGSEYQCNRNEMGESYAYGGVGERGPDFTEYPFALLFGKYEANGSVYTETAGEHTISVSAPGVETSASFNSAVGIAGATVFAPALASPFEIVLGQTTWQEAHDAIAEGRYVYSVFKNAVETYVTHYVYAKQTTAACLIRGLYVNDDAATEPMIATLEVTNQDDVLA